MQQILEDNYPIAYGNGHEIRIAALIAVDSSVYAENVTFTGTHFEENEGMQNGFGVYLVGSGTDNDAYFDGCTIADFNKCGILVREGVSSFTFINGAIVGRGPINTNALNGMQISCGNYNVKNNEIRDLDYNGPTAETEQACGILLVSYGNVTYTDADQSYMISNNIFSNVQNNCLYM